MIKDGEIRAAWELLDPILAEPLPAATGSLSAVATRSTADRGWEWYYLSGLCRLRLGVVRNPGGIATHVVFHPHGGSYFTGDEDGNVVEWNAHTGDMLRTFWNSGRKEIGLGFGLRWHDGQLTVVSQTVLKDKRTEEDIPEPGDVVVALSDSTGRMVPLAELDAARIAALVHGPLDGQLELDVKPQAQGQVKHYKVTRRMYDCLGQSSAISALTISPDGTLLGTAGFDKTFRIWGLEGYLFPTLITGAANLPDSVTSMAISPNNDQIAVAIGSRVTLGSLRPGALRVEECGETANRHKEMVTHLGFVPHRPWLASVANDGTLKLWDVATKKLLRTVDVIPKDTKIANRDVMMHLALSPDGKRIAAVITGQGKLLCWSVDDSGELKLLDKFSEKPKMFYHVAFRPSDGLLAATAYDGIVRLFDHKGAEVRRLPMHSGPVGDIAFSPDGKLMASTSRDNSVSVRRLDVREQVQHMIKQEALALKLTPDGRRLITATGNTVSVWDSASGRLLRRHKNLKEFFAMTSRGKKFVSARDGAVVEIDLATGHEETCYTLPSGKILSLASNPEGNLIAATNDDAEKPRVMVFDVSQKRVVQELRPNGNTLKWVVLSRDGTTLAHRASDSTVEVWRWKDRLQHAVVKTGDRQFCGEFQPVTNDLVLGGLNGVVEFWRFDDNNGELQAHPRRQLKGHRSIVVAINFTRDGRRMVTGGADATVRIWDPEAGQELLNLQDSNNEVFTVAFGDQDWRLISGGGTFVDMWDTAILSPQATRDDPWFYLVCGCVRSNLGLWEQAIEDFSAAIKRGIDDPYVWQYRGAAQAPEELRGCPG